MYQFYVVQLMAPGMPQIEYMTPEEYWEDELSPNISTQKVVVESEDAAHEWQALYSECETQKAWPNQSDEEWADNMALVKKNETRMHELEEAGKQAWEHGRVQAQKKVLNHVQTLGDEVLYPQAKVEAERWIACEMLKLNGALRQSLTVLSVAGKNGQRQLDEYFSKEFAALNAPSSKKYGGRFYSEIKDLLTGLQKILDFKVLLNDLLKEYQYSYASELHDVVLTQLQQAFVQHFVNHFEYIWAEKHGSYYGSTRVRR